VFAGKDVSLFQKLKPEHAFISFFYNDAYSGNEFCFGSGAANCPVIRNGCTTPQKLLAHDLRLSGFG
jgi:hypothetical protein